MATVFTYLLIAGLLAPVVWLMWWGSGSLGGPARLRAAVAPSPRVRTSPASYSFPQPADMALPRHSKAITICRLSDGAEIPFGYRSCLVGSYEVYRQAVSTS